MKSKLIEHLQNAALYDHRVSNFEVLETHISWVILTGPYAYKIKKIINFGFVDFTELERRRFYCFEELRLNRRLAPELYLDVCTVTGSDEQPVIDGSGQAIEYMIKMKQFEQQDLLNNLAAQNQLEHLHINSLANTIASFHLSIDQAAGDSIYGKSEQILRWVEQNFQQIKPLLQTKPQINQLEQLHRWTKKNHRNLGQKFLERKKQGFVRECHGDLHLGNIALINGEVTVFDGIEFNDELRWIDVISEIAFLIMDLHDRNQSGLANRFLDQYLTVSGDYQGLSLLPFYLVYRALVRGKVDLLRLSQSPLAEQHSRAIMSEYQSYIDLALSFTKQQSPVLFITHGLSGSGKSTLATRVVEELNIVRIRSDVERKRLFSLSAKQSSDSSVGSGIYTTNATSETYRQLARLCEQVIEAGFSVIADAGFLQQWQRQMFQQSAQKLGVEYIILDLQAPVEVLRQRVEHRRQQHQDPSEANLQVLESQLHKQQVLTCDEKEYSITVESNDKGFSSALITIAYKLTTPSSEI